MNRLKPRLIAITDCTQAAPSVWLERLRKLAFASAPGSVMIQLRDRQLSLRERANFGAALRAISRETGQLLAVNDRIDLALVLQADAIHLGETSVSTADARLIAKDLWISRAVHNPEMFASLNADAGVLSPIIAPRKGNPALGVAAIAQARAVRREETLIYALGGVSAENARACLEAGADGTAAISAVLATAEQSALISALGIERVDNRA